GGVGREARGPPLPVVGHGRGDEASPERDAVDGHGWHASTIGTEPRLSSGWWVGVSAKWVILPMEGSRLPPTEATEDRDVPGHRQGGHWDAIHRFSVPVAGDPPHHPRR